MTGFFGKLFCDPSVCYSWQTMVRRPLNPTGTKFLPTLVLRTTGLQCYVSVDVDPLISPFVPERTSFYR